MMVRVLILCIGLYNLFLGQSLAADASAALTANTTQSAAQAAGPVVTASSSTPPPLGYQASVSSNNLPSNVFDPLQFTLGPDDAVEINVMRHPEFSGIYPISQEGKLQYKFVGDIDVKGMTKKELEQKIQVALSKYVVSPEVSVTVTEYRSKVFYVLGQVGAPGKYFMRSETIPVREAVFVAGLPTSGAAMRKCRIISPKVKGKAIIRKVDLYSVLYGGNLKKNVLLRPGDILYVPSTIMEKILQMIRPPAEVVGTAAAPAGAAAL